MGQKYNYSISSAAERHSNYRHYIDMFVCFLLYVEFKFQVTVVDNSHTYQDGTRPQLNLDPSVTPLKCMLVKFGFSSKYKDLAIFCYF